MTFRISKLFDFSASHRLAGLPEGHGCGRLHGHNYRVRVELSADELDELGFVRDYGELAPVKTWIDAHFDHRHLNDAAVLRGLNPTAEILARTLHRVAAQVLSLDPARVRLAVEVSETPKTWARYEP